MKWTPFSPSSAMRLNHPPDKWLQKMFLNIFKQCKALQGLIFTFEFGKSDLFNDF